MHKQVIVLRRDLSMSRGKYIAQGAHASLGAYESASNDIIDAWKDEGQKKIALGVDGREALESLVREAQARDLPTHLVHDAGQTELAPGTMTALGIGPGNQTDIDAVTGELETL